MELGHCNAPLRVRSRSPRGTGAVAPAAGDTGNVLILDTETTGFGKDSECIEVGAILYSTWLSTSLMELSFLLPLPPGKTNDAEAINKISADATRAAPDPKNAVLLLDEMAKNADFALAHNADFDRRWFTGGRLPRINISWLCTMKDIHWKLPVGSKLNQVFKLTDLALAFGIPVDPAASHRALADCRYIARALTACGNPVQLVKEASAVKITVRGLQDHSQNSVAKGEGFKWDSEKREWIGRFSEDHLRSLRTPWEKLAPAA